MTGIDQLKLILSNHTLDEDYIIRVRAAQEVCESTKLSVDDKIELLFNCIGDIMGGDWVPEWVALDFFLELEKDHLDYVVNRISEKINSTVPTEQFEVFELIGVLARRSDLAMQKLALGLGGRAGDELSLHTSTTDSIMNLGPRAHCYAELLLQYLFTDQGELDEQTLGAIGGIRYYNPKNISDLIAVLRSGGLGQSEIAQIVDSVLGQSEEN